MSPCATVSVSAEEFRLAGTLRAKPPVSVELERIVPINRRSRPCLWMTGVDSDTGLQRLRADSDVRDAKLLAEGRNGLLAGIDWQADHLLLEALADASASCLAGRGTANGWQLSLRFPSRKQLADCYQQCGRGGVSLTVDRIHSTSWSAEGSHEAVLTDPQRETLLVALEAGYFAVPRGVTLQDLAEEFDVSDTAISQRIRRGVARLLTAELTDA